MKTIPLLITFIASLMLVSHQAFGFGVGADNFANATPVSGTLNYSDETNILTATEEFDEPNHRPTGSANLGHTVWWSFTPSDDGYCTIDTQRTLTAYNGTTNTTVAVYTGTVLSSLTRVAASSSAPLNYNTLNTMLGQVRFFAIKNTTYKIAVDGSFSIGIDQYNVVLQVRHLPLKKVAYTSLVTLTQAYNQMGMINVNTTATGGLTGKLTLGLKTFSFAGFFNLEGRFSTTFIPKGTKITTPITLNIDGVYNPTFHLIALGETMPESQLVEKRVYSSAALNTLTGTYTASSVTLPFAPPQIATTSQAVLTLKIKPTGQVTAVGFAQDGSAFTASGNIHYAFSTVSNAIILYKALNKGMTEVVFITDVIESGATDILDNGIGVFYREPSAGPLYPAGLNYNFRIIGATYTKPLANSRPYGFLNPNGNGFFRIPTSAEVMGGIQEALNLDTKNKFTFATATPPPVLKLNPATGLLTGSMILPNGAKSTIKGVLHLDTGAPVIKGFATGTAEHHGVTISDL